MKALATKISKKIKLKPKFLERGLNPAKALLIYFASE
jgi:hypothetical protein